jgi:fumarate hydratase class II
MATALNPVLGYDRVAKITRKALQEGLSPKSAAVELGFITPEEYERWVRPELMVAPGMADHP